MKNFISISFFLFLFAMPFLQAQVKEVIHLVEPGETLYGISKQYAVSVDHILNYNPYLRIEILEIGDQLVIHRKEQSAQAVLIKEPPPFEVEFDDGKKHIVSAQETLYSLSKKYDISVKSILAYNPDIQANVIHVSDTLLIPLNVVVNNKTEVQNEVEVRTMQGNFFHTVNQGETLYGIAKRYEVPLDKLIEMNPSLDFTIINIGDTLVLNQEKEALSIRSSNQTSMEVVWDEPREPSYIPDEIETTPSGKVIGPDGGEYRPTNPDKDGSKSTVVVPIKNQNNTASTEVEYTPENIDVRGPRKAYEYNSKFLDASDDQPTYFDRLEETEDATPGKAYINDQERIIHIVKAGETLYRLSKKYDTPIPNLVRWNNLTSVDLAQGQQLTVLVSKEEFAESSIAETPNEEHIAIHEIDYSKLKPITHTVKEGETLIDIASKYNQKLEIMKKWNEIDEYDPLPDRLIVGWYLPKGQDPVQPVRTASAQESDFRSLYNRRNRDQLNYKLVRKRSKGTWLRDDSSFDKNYYALHRSAPPKSYLRVVNPMNNKTIYVKVIGKLPDTGENVDVDLKLTFAAVKKLGLRDEKFLIDWSYHVPKN